MTTMMTCERNPVGARGEQMRLVTTRVRNMRVCAAVSALSLLTAEGAQERDQFVPVTVVQLHDFVYSAGGVEVIESPHERQSRFARM